jgi:hypothetical protein
MLGMEIELGSIEKLKGETEKMLSELEETRGMLFSQSESSGFKERPGYIRYSTPIKWYNFLYYRFVGKIVRPFYPILKDDHVGKRLQHP